MQFEQSPWVRVGSTSNRYFLNFLHMMRLMLMLMMMMMLMMMLMTMEDDETLQSAVQFSSFCSRSLK